MNYPKKRLGQHFLTDSYILDKIVASISPKANDNLVEIGAGKGILTKRLAAELNQLTAIEIDTDLLPFLQDIQTRTTDTISLMHSDALSFDYSSLFRDSGLLRIAGNLPYNISTPLIFHLLTFSQGIQDMHFLLQKEVVQRLAASPGSKDFGRLSIMVQYQCKVENLFPVAATSFNPPPKVESAVVRLIPWKTRPYISDNHALLTTLVKTAFSQRRKMLRKSLRKLVTVDEFEIAGIEPERRPETVSVAEFVRLSNVVSVT